MKRAFLDYLKSVDLTQKAFIARVETALARTEALTGEKVERIIIEDAIDQEGTRQYLHFVAFTSQFLATISEFATETELSLYPLDNNIHVLRVAVTDYEVGKPTTTSRIHVEFDIGSHEGWTLQGTRENCDVIWEAVQERVRPNLAP
jgi:hypothetical protein